MQVFEKSSHRDKITVLHDIPQTINFSHGKKSMASFSDGSLSSIGCMGCALPKCIFFSDDEIHCDAVPGFSADNNNSVCPTNAISWNYDTDTPLIDETKCIKCGVCLNRCPVGAIYYNNGIKINSTLSEKQKTVPYTIENARACTEQIENISVEKAGIPILESDDLMFEIYQELLKADYKVHNYIARNLLISLGCKCSIRRIGDVYTRMDAFYSAKDSSIGAVEVEFGHDTLDAARGILDDIAVSNTRYSIPREENLPFVVCLQLPNIRQGYWQVVKDVKNVEDIIINTVTIGSLMILNWNRCFVIPSEVTYYLDYDNTNLRSVISKQIGRDINLSDKLLGIFEPVK